MQLAAVLTTGWKDDPSSNLAAPVLHSRAKQAGDNYNEALVEALESAAVDTPVLGLDQLFRRHSGGFQAINTFVGALANILPLPKVPQPLRCHIDVFAYGFLKGAKNFDFLLPLDQHAYLAFKRTRGSWSKTMKALENFERIGELLPVGVSASANQYLALRNIVSRASARDERRVLATLQVSGPSTLEQILKELGLNHSLGQRILSTFKEIGVVERRTTDQAASPVFAIAETALPLTVFCLRETMGLDLLSTLSTTN